MMGKGKNERGSGRAFIWMFTLSSLFISILSVLRKAKGLQSRDKININETFGLSAIDHVMVRCMLIYLVQ